MGKQIVYEGPTDTSDRSTEFRINEQEDGEVGDLHILRQGLPVEIPDALAAELLQGSKRTEGHGFAEAGKVKAEPEEPAEKPAEKPQGGAQGAQGGSGSPTPGGAPSAPSRS